MIGPQTGLPLYLDRQFRINVLDDNTFLIHATEESTVETTQGVIQAGRKSSAADREALHLALDQWINANNVSTLVIAGAGSDDAPPAIVPIPGGN